MALSDSEQAYRARLALKALRDKEKLLLSQRAHVGRTQRLGEIRYAIALLDHEDPESHTPSQTTHPDPTPIDTPTPTGT